MIYHTTKAELIHPDFTVTGEKMGGATVTIKAKID